MDRGEFLSILRESLEGCIPLEDVEENVTFYRNYFSDSDRSDKELIEELGDPRLIARTIIEAYRASKGPMADFYTEQARSEYSQEHSETYESSDKSGWSDDAFENSKADRIKHHIIGIVIAIVFILILVVVLKVFVLYLLPIILVILLVKFIVDYLS